MTMIPLTPENFAIVDPEDVAFLSRWKWQFRSLSGRNYAYRKTTIKGVELNIAMHREILGVADPKVFVDHKNGNGLDNRKDNLRMATNSQNQANRQKLRGGTSRYKGVCWNAKLSRWQAGIKVNGKSFHLGLFASETDAANAYDKAARERFGEFAYTNSDHAKRTA